MSTIHKIALFRNVLEVIAAMSTRQAALGKQSRCGVKGDAHMDRDL
jgi:hypothetical protein